MCGLAPLQTQFLRPGFEEFVALTGLPQGSLTEVKLGGSALSVPGFYVASYLNLE